MTEETGKQRKLKLEGGESERRTRTKKKEKIALSWLNLALFGTVVCEMQAFLFVCVSLALTVCGSSPTDFLLGGNKAKVENVHLAITSKYGPLRERERERYEDDDDGYFLFLSWHTMQH